MIGSTVNIADVFRFAEERGCTLRIGMMDNRLLYWVESRYFIGRPYSQMNDLVEFLETLPLVMPGEAAANFSL
ncbi:hypothetical protein [Thermoleptolyngbya sp. PKUAC-SCTB121]|uniref:hypothetical protein n=1 Tax=Thermoleptolyngbya sp. PKUAC-SCTB121 TaxID=2811482 RepID=UPI0019629758|nr:hypothetical protein [Thermoleptolyngbya sp. PKUAC-SCTB121]